MRDLLSPKAAALGLQTLADAKRAFLRQAPIWWLGHRYHCPVCAVEFIRAEDAADHLLQQGHPVLRADSPPFGDAATTPRRDQPSVAMTFAANARTG